MLGAGVVGLGHVLACLGYAGGVVLLCLAIVVSRDSYLCLCRCYEIDGDDFFERRWRHRRERAARRALRAKIARQLACGADAAVGTARDATDNTKTTTLDRAASDMSGPGGPEDPIAMALDEDELDTDAPQRVKDAVTLVDAQTGEEVDLLAAEADYCRRRALMRGKASADALEAGQNINKITSSSTYIPPERPTLALFHEYPALSRWAFGRRLGTLLLTPFQVALIVGICISYNIVGAEALYSIVASSRALAQTAAAVSTEALSALPKAPFYIAFAAAQALLAVTCGSIAESGAVSLGGVIASVVYCGVASALSLAIVAWRNANPSLAPPLSHTPADALYNPAGPATGPDAPGGPTLGAAFTALNAVAMFLFTMGGHNIALETQAVLPVPPPSTIPAMTKGVNVAFLITALACFWTGLTGYSAFGSFVGENILTTISAAAVGATTGGASKTNPLATWPAASIVAVRVACIVAEFAIFAHVLAAYNVYAQTLWVGAERRLSRRWKDWRACAEEMRKKRQQQGNKQGASDALPSPPASPRSRRLSLSPSTTEALARAPLRLLYVVAVLAVAVSVPFFWARRRGCRRVLHHAHHLCAAVRLGGAEAPHVRSHRRRPQKSEREHAAQMARGRVLGRWGGGLGRGPCGHGRVGVHHPGAAEGEALIEVFFFRRRRPGAVGAALYNKFCFDSSSLFHAHTQTIASSPV